VPTHIFGIRHHGPGSARHTLQALQELRPDIILIEGPPEGEVLLEWATHADMHPPVAMLAYEEESPQNAVFYPFSVYSPEWQAILYGQQRQIPVRFMDMPLVHQLALDQTTEDTATTPRTHPITYLAEIAGFSDAEAWWEVHFEDAIHPTAVFDTIKNAMAALREHQPEANPYDLIREAFMRRAIRKAANEMYDTIAVVCGAWHAPVLDQAPDTEEADNALLKNLTKTKVAITWIPWTNDRMMFQSGYGAGILSPGWYAHHWQHPHDDGTIWLTKTAHVFRKGQKDISSAHIIETVRLANALAQLRDVPRPGLHELTEATRSVMCMGDDTPLGLLKEHLIVGNDIGQVPDGTPRSPLQKDFEDQLRSLRLKIAEHAQILQLDLRNENDLKKSLFLHRLKLLGVEWGKTADTRGRGTFKEEWHLYWRPELMISLVEKANWGNTIESASNQYVRHLAEQIQDLGSVVQLLHTALMAELPQGSAILLQKMDVLAAGTSDIRALLSAFPPLAELYKYGNVRKTDQTFIGTVLHSIFYRALASLPTGCCGINEDQAGIMANHIQAVHAAIRLLDAEQMATDWANTLQIVLNTQQTAPFLQGICCKLLYDGQSITPDETAQFFSRALSPGNAPLDAAQWLEGFLSHSAVVLLLDENIWRIVNEWMTELEEATFIQLLPLIRRTFAEYTAAEKRKIAAKVKNNGPGAGTPAATLAEVNRERAQRVLPVLELLLLPSQPV
jgi:hypothetical protein